jgi:hypothetical protein
MPGVSTAPSFRSGGTTTWITTATALLADGICVWCERAPSSPTSYLCRDCAQVDAEGVMARPLPPLPTQTG